MSASILIRDGDPWWASPDIWTVPGADPDGPPAIPAVGESSFVWTRVSNTGETELQDIQVNFYWSNPATGVLRSNSTLIGSAFASIPAGESREVLCLTPWVPAGVNNAHECLVSEAIHTADPLPSPLPDSFSPRTYDQVAQRNIDLVRLGANMMWAMAIQVAAPRRKGRSARLELRRERGPLNDEILTAIGLPKGVFEPELGVRAGLAMRPELSCDRFNPSSKAALEVPPGERRAVYLQLATTRPKAGLYTWMSLVDRDAETGEEVGGISVVVVGEEG